MADSLSGRTAIVTGGATLVGRGVVDALTAAGAQVMIADIDSAGGAAAAAGSPAVRFRQTDITADDEVAALVTETVSTFGGIDIVVNLACTYLDDGPDTSRQDWLTALDVNLVSAVVLVAAARPYLAASGHGAVVNFTSISAKIAQTGRWVYPVSKAGLVQLTRSMALDLRGDAIRVNSVSPGWTWSKIMDDLSGGDRAKTDRVAAPFHVTGRVGDPLELGRVVVFLCSDAASIVTGADWAADGGYSALGPEQQTPAIPALGA